MDKRIQTLHDETTALNGAIKTLKSTLASLNSTMSTADLRSSVANMETERAEIVARLTSLRSGTVQPVSKEEKEQVEKDLMIWDKAAAARKKIVKEMWGQIAEGLPEGMQAAELKVSISCCSWKDELFILIRFDRRTWGLLMSDNTRAVVTLREDFHFNVELSC